MTTQESHRDKLLDRLVKLKAVQEGEATLGNTAAAEAFAATINRMLVENELELADVEAQARRDKDPIIELRAELAEFGVELKQRRVAWQEALAAVVAEMNMCRTLLVPRSNTVFFVGTRAHAQVAGYLHCILVRSAAALCDDAYGEYGRECARRAGVKGWIAGRPGFKESWLTAFISRVAQRMHDERRKVVAAASDGTTALLRLDQAMVKAATYVEEKYKKEASALNAFHATNAEGFRAGRAAADKVALNRRGVDDTAPRGLLQGAE